MDSASNTFAVKMTKWNLQHNHSLTEYGFRQHPSNRMKIDEKTMQTGDQLRQAEGDRGVRLRLNPWQKDQLHGVISLLVYASTELEYKKHFRYMVHLASIGYTLTEYDWIVQTGQVDGPNEIESGTYTTKRAQTGYPGMCHNRINWDNCRGLWCAHKPQEYCYTGQQYQQQVGVFLETVEGVG
ncbi:hypothetical protein GQ600_15466 [Phytophthora cactorum]|nr:hypothetical protein GQ600_15466 [Phytophthora cactorum]